MEQRLRFLAFACLLVFAELGYVSVADDAGLTYLLDGMTEFRIEYDGRGECINDEGNLAPCEEKKHSNIWKWEGKQLLNVFTKKCLLYVHEGNVTVGNCSSDGKKTITNTWKCDKKNEVLANRKGYYGLKANDDGTINADTRGASYFHIHINKPDRPKIMICALWYDMGKRTNDPNYYFFKNEDFKITWPTKYVKFYVIFGRRMYRRMVYSYGNDADAAIHNAIVGGISALDKEYRRINIRPLLTGYEVWKRHSPINDTDVYPVEKAEVRNYSFNYLRSKYDFDSCIYVHGSQWINVDGSPSTLGGAGMSDICRLNRTRPKTEVFIMAQSINDQEKFHNLISHEFGHQVFQGHNFEPQRPCPFYHMFGSRCTMGGNDQPKGFSKNFFRKLTSREKIDEISCLNQKPNLQKIQSPKICGNGVRDPGEECDCGNSQECLTSNPCCDGMICRLKAGAECSNEKCCSNCKMQTTGQCEGTTKLLKAGTGTIKSRYLEYNNHRHWKIVANAGQRIVLRFSNLWFDFHINCSYDYIEVRDGGDKTGKLLGRYCSHVNFPSFIESSSNELFITFHADLTFSSKFQIDYFTVGMTGDDQKGQFSISMDSLEKGKTVRICENKSKQIICDVGKTIRYISGKYGNLNTASCGGSGNSLASNICVEDNSEAKIWNQCEGKRTCRLYANSEVFGKKCNGTLRSLEAKYYCKANTAEKRCVAYAHRWKSMVIRKEKTCSDQFKWLDNNILYHIGSKRCMSRRLVMTNNCYSASNAHFKRSDFQMRSLDGRCWTIYQGTVVIGRCDNSIKKVFTFHESK